MMVLLVLDFDLWKRNREPDRSRPQAARAYFISNGEIGRSCGAELIDPAMARALASTELFETNRAGGKDGCDAATVSSIISWRYHRARADAGRVQLGGQCASSDQSGLCGDLRGSRRGLGEGRRQAAH